MVEEFWFDGSAGQPADGIQQPEELQQTTTEWTYDSLGRLVDEAIDHWDDNFDQTESYTYDLTGNRTKVARLSEAVPNPTTLTDADYDQITAYTYDANDRLLEEVLDDLVDDANDTTTTYGYDHTQQTSKTEYSGLPGQLGNVRSEQSFTYNPQGRLASAVLDTYDSAGTLQARQRSSYEYDYGSFRVGQLVENWNETTGQFDLVSDTEFLVTHQNHTGYAQTLRETTTNADGSTKTVDYTFGHDEIAQRVVERDSAGTTTNDSTHVFGHDGHGSVRVLYDIAATADSLIEAVATYSSYGVLLATHASDGTLSPVTFDLLTSLTYSGEAWDSVLNRGYNRARWYDAASAQWNRLDPFAGNMQDPQSLHKYAYVHGDPILGIDPSGLSFTVSAMLSNISAGLNARAESDSANTATGAKTASALHRIQTVIRRVEKVVDRAGDLVDTLEGFADLLELSQSDLDSLKQDFNILNGLPSRKIQKTIKLPAKISRKLKSIVRIASRYKLLTSTQEFAGEIGASLVSSAAGLVDPGFDTHPVNGIDQLRYSEAGNFWAIIEAKGGRSRLGHTKHIGRQMSRTWIRHWINDTIDRNPFHRQVNELRRLKARPYSPALAAVVRVNALGKRWEVKITANKFDWNENPNWSRA